MRRGWELDGSGEAFPRLAALQGSMLTRAVPADTATVLTPQVARSHHVAHFLQACTAEINAQQRV